MAEKSGRAEATHRERASLGAQAGPLPGNWPQDADGNYMAIVCGACSDLVPTVQFGNVLVGPVSIQRPVSASSMQEIIDAARETQRAAEYVVGVERRLLQWAIDPSARVQNPITAEDAFAAPPSHYDTSMAADPRGAIGEPAVPVPVTPTPAPAAAAPMPDPLSLHQPSVPGAPGVPAPPSAST